MRCNRASHRKSLHRAGCAPDDWGHRVTMVMQRGRCFVSRLRSALVGMVVVSVAWVFSCSVSNAADAGAGSGGAWIGVTVEPVDHSSDAHIEDRSDGVVVSEVAGGGPAARAGI